MRWFEPGLYVAFESDLADLSLLPGAGRAGRIVCPPDLLRDGHHDVRIRQSSGELEQKVVWIELRIHPARTESQVK